MKYAFRIDRLSHGIGLLVSSVRDKRYITSEFFEKLDHLGRLLLAEQRKFQGQLFAQFCQFIVSLLRGINQNNHIEGCQRECHAQTVKGRRIECSIGKDGCERIVRYPTDCTNGYYSYKSRSRQKPCRCSECALKGGRT